MSGIDYRTTGKTVGRRKYAEDCNLQISWYDNEFDELEGCFSLFSVQVAKVFSNVKVPGHP